VDDNAEGPIVTHDKAGHRFNVTTPEGLTAFLNYRLRDNDIVLVHTEVPAALQDQGIGQALARAALNYAQASGLSVVPQCSFVASYLRRHPEYASLVRAPRK